MPALDGMRILDMTLYEAGTSCTQALAWLGADVVKVEPPGTGDPGRGIRLGLWEEFEYFINWNCNKRSVVIDVGQPEGRDLLLKMIPKYDVFIENYGPGVIEKLDLGYEVMEEAHPALIYGRIKGFGTTGPYAEYKSFDAVAQAASGCMSITGTPDGPPLRSGPMIGDSGTGMQLALAVTAAYVQKQRTGKGQLIEISMQEALTYYMRTSIAMGSNWGTQSSARRGNGANPAVNIYPCKPFGPNDYVFIMAVSQRMWKSLCRTIERPDLLEDKRFNEYESRTQHSELLMPEIEKWTRERTKYEAMKILSEAGVPASAVLDTKDLFNDPHLVSRGFIHTVEHEEQGPVPLLGWPARMSESEVPIQAAPVLGRHTEEVLTEDLGLDASDLETLRNQGTIETYEDTKAPTE